MAVGQRARAVAAVAGLGSLAAFQRDRLGFLRDAALLHGDVARFRLATQSVVLLSHPELARAVLVTHQRSFRKGPVLRQARVVLGDGLLTAEGEAHRRHRRLVQPAFHAPRIAGYGAAMVEAAADEADRWHPGALVDAAAAMHRVALRITGRTLFAADTRDRADAVRTAIDDVLAAYATALLPFGPQLRRLPIPAVRRLHRGVARLDALVEELLAARRGDPIDHGDLLSMLLLARDDVAGALDDDEVRDEVVTLLLAGHETTAATLAWVLHLLAAHPEVQGDVRAEADRLPDDPGISDLDALPRTRAVVAEALRLFPPSWGITRQAAVDVVLGGTSPEGSGPGAVAITAGDVVVVSPWVLHRDPRWWVQPDRFAPERWDGADPRRPRRGFLPFGAGTRMCIGESFAWCEATLVIAVLARRWSWRATGRMPAAAARLTLRPHDGAPLLITPRGSA